MRDEERNAIVESILRLDPGAEIYLFGSRVDDSKKGGDIDVLVLSDHLDYTDKLAIKKGLFLALEEQKIDIVIARDRNDPFVCMALEQGVRLK